VLGQVLWFVGLMSLYAISITHTAGWAAATPVDEEDDGERPDRLRDRRLARPRRAVLRA